MSLFGFSVGFIRFIQVYNLVSREVSIVDFVGTVDENVKQMCVGELCLLMNLDLVL